MKTTIEVNGYEIVIQEADGMISVSAMKDGEMMEEFELETGAQTEGDIEDMEDMDMEDMDMEDMGDDDMKDFDQFGSEEEEVEDFDSEDESQDDDDDEEEEEEEESEGKLESFQSFLKKRKK